MNVGKLRVCQIVGEYPLGINPARRTIDVVQERPLVRIPLCGASRLPPELRHF